MDGKRVAQRPSEHGKKRPRAAILLSGAAVLAVGLFLSACFYAASYEAIFPGVRMEGPFLAGMTLQEAQAYLEGRIPEDLNHSVYSATVGGEILGEYTLPQLGGYVLADEAAQAAYAVGRASGPLGWFQNGWTMARGLLGGETALHYQVHYNRATLSQTVARMAADFDRPPLDGSYELTKEGLFATKHLDGRKLDQEAMIRSISGENKPVVSSIPIPQDPLWQVLPAKALSLTEAARSLSPTPSPARYDIGSGKVVDGRIGVRIDAEEAAKVLDAAQGGQRVQLPAELIFPTLTAQELEAALFRDLLSSATTKVSGTKARKENVRLAAQAVNGAILNEGDTFDFNLTVGERTVERGYGEAPSYVDGETVNTVGGGICQVSSTLYYAALLANLEIVERYSHRYYPQYIDLGMDATVSWGGPEFRFKNDTGFPIRIDTAYENGELTVSVYGTKTDDTYVKMTREVLKTTGYDTEYLETEDLPWGTQREKQNGYTGYEVESFRNLYSGDGTLLSTTPEATSSYKNRGRIILVGVEGRPAAPLPPELNGDEDAPPEQPGEEEPSLPPEEETETPEPVLPPEETP